MNLIKEKEIRIFIYVAIVISFFVAISILMLNGRIDNLSADLFNYNDIDSGKLYAWGNNQEGRLGNNSSGYTSTLNPTQIGLDVNWDLVSAGNAHSLGIKDGKLYGWGRNWNGQVGEFPDWPSNNYIPRQIGGYSDWDYVSSGGAHSLGIRAGKLYGWGSGGANGTTGDTTVPTMVGTFENWNFISAGEGFSLAIRGGKLYAWGENSSGQLGIGNNDYIFVPEQVGIDEDWQYVSAGMSHSLGIKNGQLYSWGYNWTGQLGTGDSISSNVPIRIGTDSDWECVSAGVNHSLGIRGGRLYSWGWNQMGQLGNHTNISSFVPIPIAEEYVDWEYVDASYHSLAVRQYELYSWGYNNKGQLGDGYLLNKNIPTRVGDNYLWQYVSAGNEHTLSIVYPGERVKMPSAYPKKTIFKEPQDITLGIETEGAAIYYTTNGDVPTVQSNLYTNTITISNDTVLSVKGFKEGLVESEVLILNYNIKEERLMENQYSYSWGDNWYGQLGDGTNFNTKSIPGKIEGDVIDWDFLSAGDMHSLGIKDGKLYTWGYDVYESKVKGINVYSSYPSQVGTDIGWEYVSVGYDHSLGIREGKLFSWGINGSGQLGYASPARQKLPLQVGTDIGWTSVAAGNNYSLGIRDGKLYSWGNNAYRQLGDDTTINRSTPVQISLGRYEDYWDSISAGKYYAMGIRNGELFTWGMNTFGVLGIGGTNPLPRLNKVGYGKDWEDISAGNFHSLGIRDGKLYAWGRNVEGQVGDGTKGNRFEPTLIGDGTNWEDISAGHSHSLGILSGSLYSWGNNEFGQLGDGTNIEKLEPFLVGDDNDWGYISAGYNNSFGMKISDIVDNSVHISGTIYYDYDGDNGYNTGSSDKVVSQSSVRLYSVGFGGVVIDSTISGTDGLYGFNGVTAGTYYIKVDPKKLFATGKPMTSIENNIYSIKPQNATEIYYDGVTSVTKDIGLHSLNTDREGIFGENMKINLSDISKLVSSDKWDTFSTSFRFLDLNYDGKINLGDLSQIINRDYFEFP